MRTNSLSTLILWNILLVIIKLLSLLCYMLPYLKNFGKRWMDIGLRLIGHPTEFPVEIRIFNSFCFVGMALCLTNIPYNFFTGVTMTAYIFIAALLIVFFCYLLVRLKQRLQLAIIIITIMVFTIFVFNYFYSGGMLGSSVLIFCMSYFLMMMVMPPKHYLLWFTMYLTIVPFLFYVEYRFPHLIQFTFSDTKSLMLDVVFTYIVSILLLFVTLRYFKMSYIQEKILSDEKAAVLNQMNEDKMQLFSIISHDLQAPLASIDNYVRLIGNPMLEDEQRREIESRLRHSLIGAQDMLSNLLVWAQNQLDGIKPRISKFQLQEVMAPTIDLQQQSAIQKGILLVTEIDRNLVLESDMDLVKLIVRNLIDNAIKYTPAFGYIKITATQFREKCMIQVIDNGPGVPIEERNKIFESGVKVNSKEEKQKGVGLGLHLCQTFVQELGGQIGYESNDPEGSIFFIVLPLQYSGPVEQSLRPLFSE
jgi:two-component system sensor histidine kinase/response regulator